jgi:hypothetical protein
MSKNGQSTDRLGLLAIGSSGRWEIAVDESLDRDEWFFEIDGPQTYLVFQLQDLKVIPAALGFLQSKPQPDQSQGRHGVHDREAALVLGRFGSASVSLLWDDEDFLRCFLVISPDARSTLRLSFEAEDIPMLVEALRQVVKDIPQVSGGQEAGGA